MCAASCPTCPPKEGSVIAGPAPAGSRGEFGKPCPSLGVPSAPGIAATPCTASSAGTSILLRNPSMSRPAGLVPRLAGVAGGFEATGVKTFLVTVLALPMVPVLAAFVGLAFVFFFLALDSGVVATPRTCVRPLSRSIRVDRSGRIDDMLPTLGLMLMLLGPASATSHVKAVALAIRIVARRRLRDSKAMTGLPFRAAGAAEIPPDWSRGRGQRFNGKPRIPPPRCPLE
ncbi:MAG: hypothetical protein M5U32_21840 [Myxococcota bacterium]|nr:hypothetical protein [Myxococcota bacterium]